MLDQAAEYERRFLLNRAPAEAFLAEVAPRLQLNVYDAVRPFGYARTTYLDTPELAYFYSSQETLSRRLRVREYASAPDEHQPPRLTGACALELKEQSGPLRAKARVIAPAEVIDYLVQSGGFAPPGWRDRLEGMQAFRVIQESLRSEQPSPRVTTWYRRASLSGEGGRVRVTLDEGPRWCRPVRLGKAGDLAEPIDATVALGPRRVVEVKYFGPPPKWLEDAMQGLEETAGFSKFAAAMRAVERRVIAVEDRSRSTQPIVIPSRLRVIRD